MPSFTADGRKPRHADLATHVPSLVRWYRLTNELPTGGLLSSLADRVGERRALMDLRHANDNTPLPLDRELLPGRPALSVLLDETNSCDPRPAMRAARDAGAMTFDVGRLRFWLYGPFVLRDGTIATAGSICAYSTRRGAWRRPIEAYGAIRGGTSGQRSLRKVPKLTDRRPTLPAVDWSRLPKVLGDVSFEEARCNAGLPPARKLLTAPPTPGLFMSGRVASTGRTPLIWDDRGPLARRAFQEEQAQVARWLSAEDCGALIDLTTAGTLEDLAPGREGKTAQRHGKARLLRAAKALEVAFREFDEVTRRAA